MHQFSNSALPYVCEITLDVGCVFGAKDVKRFESSVEHGVAVYGHTPNVLLLVDDEYDEWESICNLLSLLHTGKVAVCSGFVASIKVEMMHKSNTNILLKIFNKSQEAEARAWLIT